MAASGADGGPVYVVPRSRDVVVGGTDDEGEWDRRPDPDVAKRILARAVEVVPALRRARVLATGSGCGPRAPPYAWRSRSPTGGGSCTATATAARV